MDSLVQAFNYAVTPLYVVSIPIPLPSFQTKFSSQIFCSSNLAVVCFCVDGFNFLKSLNNVENYFSLMSRGHQIGEENLVLSKMTCSVS